MVAAIESLEKSDVADIGVEPLSDLTAWFVTSVAPRTSAVALVPEYGGGVLLHLASSLLSTMRFKRSGLVEGNDVLSVLARAEYYLHEKDLDSATRELNQLRGPPKELLRDWLAAARRRLEVQQALKVSLIHSCDLYDLTKYFIGRSISSNTFFITRFIDALRLCRWPILFKWFKDFLKNRELQVD